jgi:hypothetical protein
MSEPEDTGGTVWDAPNKQVLGLDPPWVEGTGGGDAATPKARGGGPDLDEMTKAELLDHARSIGATPANNDMTKEELRAAIEEANDA